MPNLALAPQPPPPIRHFKVGAATLGASGCIYVGANFEFYGCGLGHAIHAEQFAVTNAALAGERGLRMIATNVPPCGHCRQFLMEMTEAPDLLFLCGDGKWRLRDMLPHVFHFDHEYPCLAHQPHTCVRMHAACSGNDSSIRPRSSGLLSCARSPPSLPTSAARFSVLTALLPSLPPLPPSRFGQNKEQAEGGTAAAKRAKGSELVERALLELNRAYAPHTSVPAGVALRCGGEGGPVYGGFYIENAAFNPSIPPLQAAVIDA